MVAGLDLVRDEARVDLEVDALDGRPRREPGTLDHYELEALGERSLGAPGRFRADDAAVYEDEPLHRGILDGVTNWPVSRIKTGNRLLQAR